jgi:hypothetical protein
MLDGVISDVVAGRAFLGGLVIWALYATQRLGMVPDPKNLRDPNDWHAVAFWNMFSSRKWTADGKRAHARVLKFTLVSCFAWGIIYIALDWVF